MIINIEKLLNKNKEKLDRDKIENFFCDNTEDIVVSGKLEQLDGTLVQAFVEYAYRNNIEVKFWVKGYTNSNLDNTEEKKRNVVKNGYFDYLFNKEALKDIRKEHYDNLIIVAHGEGIHLNLNDDILCSFREDKEIKYSTIDCNSTYCRRFNKNFKRILSCSDVKSTNLFLFSCNSACVNGELYKSNYSLVDGFLSSGTKNIVCCLELHGYEKKVMELVLLLVQHNYTAGKVTTILNDISYKVNYRCPFVCFTTCYQDKSCEQNYKEIEDDSNASIIIINKKDSADFYTYKGTARIKIWSGYHSFYIFNPDCTLIELKDCKKSIEKYRYKLSKIFKGIKFWEFYFEKYDDKEVIDLLEQSKKAFHRIYDNLEQYLIQGLCEDEILKNNIKVFENELNKYQLKILKNIITKTKISSIENIFYRRYKVPSVNNKYCLRDNSTIYEYTINSYDCVYKVDYCMFCGVKKIVFEDEDVICHVEKNSNEIILKYKIENTKENDDLGGRLAYVELYDKTKQMIVAQKVYNNINIWGKLVLPINDVGNDLNTLRILFLNNGVPIYVRERIEFNE